MAQKTPTGSAAEAAPLRMTYEQFLEWADEDTNAEWVNGEVVWMSPLSDLHQELALFLLRVLAAFVEERRLGKLRYERYQMKTAPHLPGREPDLLFVGNEHLSQLKGNHLEGPADLVVEIVSPESRERDCEEKYTEYEEGGVPEYWLLDQPQQQAKFYLLGEGGRYHQAPVGEEGIFRSRALPGFWLRVEWLWQDPLPGVRAVLRELGVD
jgi:Uma2 family endonuclease